LQIVFFFKAAMSEPFLDTSADLPVPLKTSERLGSCPGFLRAPLQSFHWKVIGFPELSID
jgi:hypothetical protein